jgi:hypothetical protein
MSGLSQRQASIITALFAAAGDSAVLQIEQALSEEADQGGPLGEVCTLISKEARERRLRAAVLGPVIPLCKPSSLGDRRFPTEVMPLLWRALRQAHPDLIDEAEQACFGISDNEEHGFELYDNLCALAAEGLRSADAPFAATIAALYGAGDDGVSAFIDCLDLVPLARRAIMRLPEWLGRMSSERAAAARLAYKDAVSMSDDAGPRLIAMLLAHLPEPWLILRILAAVVTRANDRYLAGSELCRFGDYVLDDIDRQVAALRAFDPDLGREAGAQAAKHLHVAAQEVTEFTTTLELSKDGPWGVRVAKAKQALAELGEARLGQIEKAVDQALPLQMIKFGKGVRGAPRLSADLDARLLRRAEGLMGFFDHARASAATCGFGSTRAKVGEAMEARLDQYIEDLLEALRSDEVADVERIQAYLDAAADLIGDIRGEKAAQIVRRRAAAA